MKEFHEQLKKAMEMRKVTQSELCEMTGIPKSAMSQYISGAFKPKQTRTYLIAKALRVNEAWLMGWDESVLETLEVLDSIADPDHTSAQVKEQDARIRKAISEMSDMQLYDDLEIELIKKYRTLDGHGKKMVDFTLNEEYERCTAQESEEAKKANIEKTEYPFRSAARNGVPPSTETMTQAQIDEIESMPDL